MPFTFTEKHASGRQYIDKDGTYLFTVVSNTLEMKDGHDVWKVGFETPDGASHIEKFEFSEEWAGKLFHFLKALGFNVQAGSEIDPQDKDAIFGHTAKAEVAMKPDKGSPPKFWPRVSKWLEPEKKTAPTLPTLRKL